MFYPPLSQKGTHADGDSPAIVPSLETQRFEAGFSIGASVQEQHSCGKAVSMAGISLVFPSVGRYNEKVTTPYRARIQRAAHSGQARQEGSTMPVSSSARDRP